MPGLMALTQPAATDEILIARGSRALSGQESG